MNENNKLPKREIKTFFGIWSICKYIRSMENISETILLIFCKILINIKYLEINYALFKI